jgi:uncharacterized protein YdeI (YjbR/CyaY-like superfamily)
MLREWLAANHLTSPGVWIVTEKKAHVSEGHDYVSARAINEECLCVGWIDSKPGKVDDQRTALLCTPRKPGSGWSKVNKDRLIALMEQGLVTESGLAAISAAQADGSWSRLDDVDALIVPPDLAERLDDFPDARAHFEVFPPSARRGILEWIGNAKKPETRADRITKTAELAQDNIRALEWKR